MHDADDDIIRLLPGYVGVLTYFNPLCNVFRKLRHEHLIGILCNSQIGLCPGMLGIHYLPSCIRQKCLKCGVTEYKINWSLLLRKRDNLLYILLGKFKRLHNEVWNVVVEKREEATKKLK